MTEWRSLSRADFKTWHDKFKSDNGYPLHGRNAATGEIQPLDVGPTTDYVVPVEVDRADVRVDVGDIDDKPGRASGAPVYNDDGTVNVTKSKAGAQLAEL